MGAIRAKKPEKRTRHVMWQYRLCSCVMFTKGCERFAPHYLAGIRQDLSQTTVEAVKHPRQVTLLIPSLPVPMALEPLLSARQKLPAALLTRDADQSKLPAAIAPTDVFEAQELKGLRLVCVLRLTASGEASTEEQPCLLLGQGQVEPLKAHAQLAVEGFRIPLVLEARHKVIREPRQVRLPLTQRPELLLEPEVQDKVQVDISQDGADRTPLGRPFRRAHDDPTLHHASPQPFAYQAQDDGIGNAVGHHLSQPLMVDMVVGRERPRSPLCPSPHVKPGVRISRTGLPRTRSQRGDINIPDGALSGVGVRTTIGCADSSRRRNVAGSAV